MSGQESRLEKRTANGSSVGHCGEQSENTAGQSEQAGIVIYGCPADPYRLLIVKVPTHTGSTYTLLTGVLGRVMNGPDSQEKWMIACPALQHIQLSDHGLALKRSASQRGDPLRYV